MKEIEAAVILARRFPRNEDQAFLKIMKSLDRWAFADKATYEFPRGGTTVSGPSIYLMREMARCWGNILYGFTIVSEDEQTVLARCHAWDLETNCRNFAEVSVRKLVQRKVDEIQDGRKVAVTRWIAPDARDLRELVNNMAARTVRNCIQAVMPRDFVEDAKKKAAEVVEKGVKDDPEGARKSLVLGFGKLNVTPLMLEAYLGHSLAECSPAELVTLRGIWKTIETGQTTWLEYAPSQGQQAASAKVQSATQARQEDLKGRLAQKRAPAAAPKEAAQEPPANVALIPAGTAVEELPDSMPYPDGHTLIWQGAYCTPSAERTGWVKGAAVEEQAPQRAPSSVEAGATTRRRAPKPDGEGFNFGG